MELERQLSASTDEFFMTARQIFDICGVESTGFIQVKKLMDKFAPFVKSDNEEYSDLKSLLDPDESNPEITLTNLAEALTKYSEKRKGYLDESFNLKGGPVDSDSGISTDGFQILEELQSELREKSHLAHQLRSQLDFTDRQHEEAIVTLTAERDSLQAHLNMLREENVTLTHVRRDYEDTCERLCNSEQALGDTRRELDATKRKIKTLSEEVVQLDNEKLTLQELLQNSKEECHRINEMYASRQSALIEENESLRAECALIASKLRDQEECMQQTFKEKVILEMELKDVLNKSNQTHLRLDKSIDISYTEDQMLTALDSLNADCQFIPDQMDMGTQADIPCVDCSKRKTVAPTSGFRKYFWEPLKALCQLFAVVCFLCAISLLYGVTKRWHARCERDSVPWKWLDLHDLMDLFFRIEYVAEVPM